MLRLVNIVTLMLALLISSAHAEGNRNRDNDGNRNREDVFALVPLGERVVDFGRDYDVIEVNYPREFYIGRLFRALQFYATRNDIVMDRIRVSYFEGSPEDFPINRPIARGQQIQVDLNGDKSYIRRIEMWYRSRGGNSGQAHIRVWGEPTRVATRPPDREEWVDLGCRNVDLYGADEDRLPVESARRFRALELQVSILNITMQDLKVVDRAGAPHDIQVRRNIRAGGTSGRLNLQQGDREIDYIVMTYSRAQRTVLRPGERFQLPRVCVRGAYVVGDGPR